MATINPTPLYLKDVILTVGSDQFEKAISNAAFTPTVPTATFKGLSDDAVYTQAGAASWMVDLTFVQDWDSADSLSAYLFNNQGEEVTLTFKPKSLTGGTFSATVVIVPSSIGGAVDTYATSTVSLPMVGQPSFTPGV